MDAHICAHTVHTPYTHTLQHVRLRSPMTRTQLEQAAQEAADGTNLKNLLANVLGYGPAIAEHVVLDAGLTPSTVLPPRAAAVAAPETASQPPVGGDGEEGEGEAGGGVEAVTAGVQQLAVTGSSAPRLTEDQVQALLQASGRLDEWFSGGWPSNTWSCRHGPGHRCKEQLSTVEHMC